MSSARTVGSRGGEETGWDGERMGWKEKKRGNRGKKRKVEEERKGQGDGRDEERRGSLVPC